MIMNIDQARRTIRDDDEPFVGYCEAAGVLTDGPDSRIEDLIACLARKGLPAEMAATRLHSLTGRTSENGVILDADNWGAYLATT